MRRCHHHFTGKLSHICNLCVLSPLVYPDLLSSYLNVPLWHVVSEATWSFIMLTSSNGIILRLTGLLCGEFTGHRWIPPQWPVTRNFDVFFDLRLNKRLSKQSWGWWFETPSHSLWRHCNVNRLHYYTIRFHADIMTWKRIPRYSSLH